MKGKAPTRVLVVDDEPYIRAFAREVLRAAGHSVSLAGDGEQAIRAIRRQPFDLVLLDIGLPRANGYAVLDAIRQMPARAETPVVVITARGDADGILKEARAGVFDHLRKPFGTLQLVSVVEAALHASKGRRNERRKMLSRAADVYGGALELTRTARDRSFEETSQR
jgi:CheY-like chemotaxis protein